MKKKAPHSRGDQEAAFQTRGSIIGRKSNKHKEKRKREKTIKVLQKW